MHVYTYIYINVHTIFQAFRLEIELYIIARIQINRWSFLLGLVSMYIRACKDACCIRTILSRVLSLVRAYMLVCMFMWVSAIGISPYALYIYINWLFAYMYIHIYTHAVVCQTKIPDHVHDSLCRFLAHVKPSAKVLVSEQYNIRIEAHAHMHAHTWTWREDRSRDWKTN